MAAVTDGALVSRDPNGDLVLRLSSGDQLFFD